MTGQVYLFDSAHGHVAKVHSPAMLEALAYQAESYAVAKALESPRSAGSKRLRERYGITLDGVTCAVRPFDMALYAYATSLNTYHSRAVRAKAKDIVGGDWQIIGESAAKQRITDFFTNAFGQMTFGDGMGNVWTDYEALGNGYLEVVPTADGSQPAELTHIPAPEMWIRIDGLGYVQQKYGQYSHFRAWGIPQAAWDDLRAKALNDPLLREGVTEVIHFSRYFPWSLYYGIPAIMPAWNRLCLAVLESEYNLTFFANNAIPDYAVILEGEWGDDTENTIQRYFRDHLKGQAHKTAVFRVPSASGQGTAGKITFERLTSDAAKEGAFRLLRQDCRDEILHAHGVPPQKVGIVETGRLGGNKANEQITEYALSIVGPGRKMVTGRMNRLIASGFSEEGLTFEFSPYSTEDQEVNARVDQVYLQSKVLLPNEVRAVRFPSLAPLEGGDVPLETAADAGALGALGAVQEKIMRVARGETA